jgi:hypothetical protein
MLVLVVITHDVSALASWIFQTVKTSRNSEIHLHFVGGGTPADGGAEALALVRFSRGFDWRAVDNHSQDLHGDRIVKGFERSMIYVVDVVELSKSVVANRMVYFGPRLRWPAA